MSLLSVGQPCFAKVKGFPAWPAEVTAIQGTNKYEVFFFGTSEIASVGLGNVWDASPANIAKFVTPKVKKRKFYAVGVEEMNKLIKKQQSHPSNKDHSYSSPSKPSTKNDSVVILETLTTNALASKSPVKTAQKPKSPVKTAQNSKSPVKIAQKLKPSVKPGQKLKPSVKEPQKPKSPVKSVSVPKSAVSKPLAPSNKENHKSRTEEANETDKAAAPTEKTLPGRSSRTTSRASPKPAEKIPITETVEKPPRRSAKRAIVDTEETKQTEKKKKTEQTERIKVNIQLEMSEDAFLRVAKELPALLALTGHPIDVNMEVQKK